MSQKRHDFPFSELPVMCGLPFCYQHFYCLFYSLKTLLGFIENVFCNHVLQLLIATVDILITIFAYFGIFSIDPRAFQVHWLNLLLSIPNIFCVFRTATIEENVRIGSYVDRVHASDMDSGKNGQIFYTFNDGGDNGNGYFSVDQNGVIRTAAKWVCFENY